MYRASNDMPSDKLMRLFIIQAISSFVAGDQESGLHYLNEVKNTYAQHMSQLNPTLKSLAKEIIQSLDLFSPGSNANDLAQSNSVEVEPQAIPSDSAEPNTVNSELQNLLNKRRAKRVDRE